MLFAQDLAKAVNGLSTQFFNFAILTFEINWKWKTFSFRRQRDRDLFVYEFFKCGLNLQKANQIKLHFM